MYKSDKPIGFWSAVSMGIGAMVGAGIFALLGEASAISGSAVYISFILGGIIALFSGYSLGKLGARYPAAGGIVEYLTQAYGTGTFTGSMSIMLYLAAVVSLSLIAKAFGNYAVTFLSGNVSPLWHYFFSTGIVILFVFINLKGAKDVVVWERLIVAIKFSVLCILSVTGIVYMNPALLAPVNYPASSSIFYSLSITFFAYEGFRVITNTAEDMPDPAKTLPRAMMASILLVMVLYVAVSFAVFGNLPTDRVIAAKDFALAEAAIPIFGHAGFVVVAIAALISTASSINANLYAVTNVTYQLAKYGELPLVFGEPIGHSREGLLIGLLQGGVIMLLAVVWFELPLRGSIPALYLGLFLFLLSAVGVGLMISAISVTQQQAVLGAFLFLVPAVILSGFATPIANMPEVVQWLTYIDPLRYFLVIVRSVFMEGAGFDLLWHQYWPMALIATFSLAMAGWMFRHRMY
ncbi:MAG: amino acid transporter [Gammaproteobacteria bacterium]|nr:MAG: amino acid transporter [Gammaproteobacteria bacterium]